MQQTAAFDKKPEDLTFSNNVNYYDTGDGVFIKEDGKELNRLITHPTRMLVRKVGSPYFSLSKSKEGKPEICALQMVTNKKCSRIQSFLSIENVGGYQVMAYVPFEIMKYFVKMRESIPNFRYVQDLRYTYTKHYGSNHTIITPKMKHALQYGLQTKKTSEIDEILERNSLNAKQYFENLNNINSVGEYLD